MTVQSKLLSLEGTKNTGIVRTPLVTTLYPKEETDYNPDVSDFLGFSFKKAVKKVKKKATSSVSSLKSMASKQMNALKAQMAAQAKALQNQMQAQLAQAKKYAEQQAQALKEQAQKQTVDRLNQQLQQVKTQYGSKVGAILKNPAFQDAIIMGATTALGQPGAGLAIVSLKKALIQGDYSAAVEYAAEEGGLSSEDMKWMEDAYAMSNNLILDNQDLIKQDSFDLSQMFPGQNVPSNVIKTGAPDIENKETGKIDNKKLMIGGAVTAGLLALYFMSKR